MSERLNVKEMVMQMHEKNLVLMNILRDIAENEASCHFTSGATEEEIVRCLTDKAIRRKEILAEIRHLLRQKDEARQNQQTAPTSLRSCDRP
ncbi:hypothetical protein ACQKP1_23340 [Allorhizobium sp. NPDC080224]|uniref:hypothetical protein n=1 Tax=Allorhizobium sp. NPDC080224 TaxID=3390547 RepID=UPI003D001648